MSTIPEMRRELVDSIDMLRTLSRTLHSRAVAYPDPESRAEWKHFSALHTVLGELDEQLQRGATLGKKTMEYKTRADEAEDAVTRTHEYLLDAAVSGTTVTSAGVRTALEGPKNTSA